jgi:hypothetical protein
MGEERLDLSLFEPEGDSAPVVVVVLDTDVTCDEVPGPLEPSDSNCACE